MENVHAVQLAESFYYLHEDGPHLSLGNSSVFLFLLGYFMCEVSLTGVLHDDAAWGRRYHRDFDASSIKASR